MKVHFGFNEETATLGRTITSLGNYDGVHLGHQAILQKTVEHARRFSIPSVAVTFDPVPKKILYPETAPPLIQTLEQRLRRMESQDLDHTIVVAFDQTFARKSPEEFVRQYLMEILHIRGFVVGANFSFGHQKRGNLALLKQMGVEHDFFVEDVPEVQLDGARISSTAIRDFIRAGRVDEANRYLGSLFTLAGKIVEGERLGGKLGIPTANLDVENELLPGNGVYVTQSVIGARSHPSVTNVGFRPTFGGRKLTVEAHILSRMDDLYGQKMELQFHHKIREEMKFACVDTLRAQILQDIETVKSYFGLP